MAKMIFVNLPVGDLARANAFYQAIGATKNEQFCDETASCMVFSETIHAMLLTHDKFRQFTPKKIADAKTSSEVLICLSADSRDDGVRWCGEPVVNPQAIPPAGHQTGTAKICQVPRRFRLRDLQTLVDVAHAHLAG